MKLGFVTCVQLGFSCIQEIYNQGFTLDCIVTLPDDCSRKKSGRVYLDDFCKKNSIKLLKYKNINDSELVSIIKKMSIDWLFIIGWSQIASESILNSTKLGSIGIHPTLLPEGRGRASIPWTILKNKKVTGVTLFKLDQGVDTGDIINSIKIPLKTNQNANELYWKITEAHSKLIALEISNIFNNKITLTKQDESMATYWPGRKPEDGQLDLNDSVEKAERMIRALTKPYPGAFYICESSKKKTIIWSAELSSEKKIDEDYLSLKFSNGYIVSNNYEIINA